MATSQIGLLAMIALTVPACTSVEPLRPDMASRVLPSRLDEIAYINALRSAFVFRTPGPDGCYSGERLGYFRAEFGQGYPDHNLEQETVGAEVPRCVGFRLLEGTAEDRALAVTRYLEAGFGLSNLYCERFFIVASQSAQRRRFQRNSFSTLDTLTNAVLGFARAGERALALSNAGFQSIDSTYQNIEDAFMVAPDLANVRALVHAAQQDYRTRAYRAADLPASFEGARSVIDAYAGLCSFTGMTQLVNASVTSETRQLAREAEARNVTSGNAVAPTGTGTTDSDGAGTPTAVKPAPADQQPTRTDARVAVPASPPRQD